MADGMQKVMFCIAQRFWVVLADVAGQIGMGIVARLDMCEPAFMFEFMCRPLRIEASSANTGHQHDKHHKTNGFSERKKLIGHQISLARKNSCTLALLAEIAEHPLAPAARQRRPLRTRPKVFSAGCLSYCLTTRRKVGPRLRHGHSPPAQTRRFRYLFSRFPLALTLQFFNFWVNATNWSSFALAAPLAITSSALA